MAEHFLDGDPIRYPLLSQRYRVLRHGPLGLAVGRVIGTADGYFRPGNVMDHMTKLIRDGISFDTHQHTEIGRWDKRFDVGLEPLPDVGAGMYYAWADPNFWDYDPPLVTYTKAEFLELFEDCCRNYVAANPQRREEFAAAMAANGMSL